MGNEANCRAWFDDREANGKALLETEELIFRGDVRKVIPFATVTAAEASDDGRLILRHGGGVAIFDLGVKDAEAWARKILNPRGRLDKLGVKEGMRVSVLGVDETSFLDELRARVPNLTVGEPAPQSDIIFLGADRRDTLAQLVPLQAALKRNGAIWVVRPRGIVAITEADVMREGKAAGLVDTKVVKFSETHTAEKLVIPKDRR